jgi:hypothetical protein
LFYEEQRLPLRRVAVALLIPPCAMLGLLIWQVVLGHPWGKPPVSNGNIIGWTVFLWLVYVRLITVRLVIEVRSEVRGAGRAGELIAGLRGLWRARHVALSDIQSAETISFDPARDYGGYGIRSNRSETAYVAAGGEGVRVKLKTGAALVLGSRQAGELARILRGAA